MSKVLVTGAAGFIGFHVSRALTGRGDDVVGLDSLSDYYSVELKLDRLKQLEQETRFSFSKADLCDRDHLTKLFENEAFDGVVNLAAQAGVRHSLTDPHSYIDSNVVGFLNILEGCRHHRVQHLVFASSSSVYGANTTLPFSVHHPADHPLSLYGATKKSNELMAHAYAHLFGTPVTGLRFFTVYGPWGRPDMALFLFVKAILEDRPIQVFNRGDMQRDFTYIDDVVEVIVRALDHVPASDPSWPAQTPDPATSAAPFRIYNVGGTRSVGLERFIGAIERELGKQAIRELLPMQPGDVPRSEANMDDLVQDLGYRPRWQIEDGVAEFVRWYRDYYKV